MIGEVKEFYTISDWLRVFPRVSQCRVSSYDPRELKFQNSVDFSGPAPIFKARGGAGGLILVFRNYRRSWF